MGDLAGGVNVRLDDGAVRLHHGDCVEVMAAMPAESVDAIVTDPPYGLEFMGKDWDRLSGDAVTRSWDTRGRTMTGAPTRDATTPRGRSGAALYRKDNPRCDNCGRAVNGRATSKGFKVCECETPAPRLTAVSARKMQAWHEVWAREAFRVLKPGGHLLAFGGTRTYHRLTCAIEDAGFEIRDCLAGLYGSGFPKSLDVSKAIDKRPGVSRHAEFTRHLVERREAAGLSRADVSERVVGTRTGACWNWEHHQFPEAKWWPALRDLLGLDAAWGPVVAEAERERVGSRNGNRLAVAPGQGADRSSLALDVTAPATPEAQQWQGWGTALKPAHEPVVVARKPLRERTVAAQVLASGTGALNIDGTRIGTSTRTNASAPRHERNGFIGGFVDGTSSVEHDHGRWPANVALDREAAATLDEAVGDLSVCRTEKNTTHDAGMFGIGTPGRVYGDDGGRGPSRFYFVAENDGSVTPHMRTPGAVGGRAFYSAKASTRERDGSTHPTTKPLDLMRWLVRLVTPPGGVCLDPFAGSGTTLLAAKAEGFRAVGIERDPGYVEMAVERYRRQWAPAEARWNDGSRGGDDQLSLLGGAA
jgi:DNA modification methylase